MAFLLQPTARTRLVEMAVVVQLEQTTRIIGLATRDFCLCRAEAQRFRVESVHEGINHPYRVIFINVVIQGIR